MKELNLGQQIQAIRTSLDLTQEQLAQKSGISKDHISKIERGVISPNYRSIMKIADALNMSVSALCSVTEKAVS